MKKHISKIIGISLLLLILSCALSSKFSLPNDEKIIPELIGVWLPEKSDNDIIIIQKNNEKTYKLTVINNDGESEGTIAFSKTINGLNIMNVITKERNGEIMNVFYGINVDDNKLTYSEVNSDLRKKEFESEKDLLSFFKENVSKKDFFVNPIKLKRK